MYLYRGSSRINLQWVDDKATGALFWTHNIGHRSAEKNRLERLILWLTTSEQKFYQKIWFLSVTYKLTILQISFAANAGVFYALMPPKTARRTNPTCTAWVSGTRGNNGRPKVEKNGEANAPDGTSAPEAADGNRGPFIGLWGRNW